MRIDVPQAQRPYPVLIGAGVLAEAEAHLGAAGIATPPVVVSSPPIWRLQGDRLSALAGGAGPVLMPDGERAKTLRTVAGLYEAFAGRQVDRASTILAFGGGVVGDVAGFAAATYLRGLALVQAPTTLLAQVDSAIGGKVGVNLPAGKNLAGAFHPPILVLVDPEVLATLPRREFRAGLYEVVKYGVIASPALFDRVSASLAAVMARDAGALTPIIADCCRIKADVVGRDEREAGPRRILNFGHTIGHALEAVTKYRRFRHGEAVAYGMLAAARLSVSRGAATADDETRLSDVIRRMGPLPGIGDLSMSEVLDAVAQDKKTVAGRLHFVLCAGLGRTEIATDVTRAELAEALSSIGVPG